MCPVLSQSWNHTCSCLESFLWVQTWIKAGFCIRFRELLAYWQCRNIYKEMLQWDVFLCTNTLDLISKALQLLFNTKIKLKSQSQKLKVVNWVDFACTLFIWIESFQETFYYGLFIDNDFFQTTNIIPAEKPRANVTRPTTRKISTCPVSVKFKHKINVKLLKDFCHVNFPTWNFDDETTMKIWAFVGNLDFVSAFRVLFYLTKF